LRFLGFGGNKDKWQEYRDAISYCGKLIEEDFANHPDAVVGSILTAGPFEIDGLAPYVKYFGNNHMSEELAKCPDELRGGFALRLLILATKDIGFMSNKWTHSLTSAGLRALLPYAVPLLDILTQSLVQNQQWETIRLYKVGQYLASFADQAAYSYLDKTTIVPGGLRAAQVRGLYAGGKAAVETDDKNQAKLAWTLAGPYDHMVNDPAIQLCKAGLQELKG